MAFSNINDSVDVLWKPHNLVALFSFRNQPQVVSN